MDYAFESHYDLYSAMFFGPALMLNHAPGKEASVVKRWARGVVPSPDAVSLRPFTNYPGVSFQTRSTLKPGTEVTFTYGNEAYFAERNVPFNFRENDTPSKPPSYSIEELSKVGHCLSDIYVNKSLIPMGGKGVFSNKSHVEGSTVSVSPVLVVPKHALEKAGRSSVLMNFCFSDIGTDLALLPLGTAALINHGVDANVGVRWYSWDGDETVTAQDVLSGNLTALLRSSAAPLFLEYYALRPISEGEELLMNYGSEWDEAWSHYLSSMHDWTKLQGDRASFLDAPQFRHTISIPAGMFPPSVYQVSCFGTRDCEEYYKIRQPKILNRELNHDDSPAHHFDLNSVMEAKINLESLNNFSVQEEMTVDGSIAGESSFSPAKASPVEDEGETPPCYLYLANAKSSQRSTGHVTMGVYSGVDLQRGDVLDVSPALLASTQTMAALRRIGAPAMRGHYMSVLFGPGALARSSSNSNMDRTYDAKDRLRSIPSPQAQALRPYNINTNMLYYATSDIAEGDEVTIFSGEPEESGEVSSKPLNKYSVSELEKHGHCLTDVYLNKSMIPMAGGGLFSRRKHAVGNIVSISPSAVIAKHLLEEEASSVLINSCLSVEKSDICVLPLGLASAMNHNSNANVALRWHGASRGDSSRSAGKVLVDHLDAALQGGIPLYVEYYAVRPIEAGDELTLHYGEQWENAWYRYLTALSSWQEGGHNSTVGNDMMNAPQFRKHITMPFDMYPVKADSHPPCIGDLGCSGLEKLRRPFKVEESFNRETHSRNIFQKISEEDRGSTKNFIETVNPTLWASVINFFASIFDTK